MIKLSTDRRVVRETKAEGFEYTTEDGTRQTAEIRIRYYSPTVLESKKKLDEMKAVSESEGGYYWYSMKLFGTLAELPDLVDENDRPFEITTEFLETLSTANLKLIHDAIEEDLRPKEQGTKSQNGLAAKASSAT